MLRQCIAAAAGLALAAVSAFVIPSASAQRPRTSPEAGAPRSWEAGKQVSPFSVVNLWNGNLLTALHIASYDPVGPPVSFSIYHNNAAAVSQDDIDSPWGFDLGPGWSISFGTAIIGNAGGNVTLLEADGNLWTYSHSGGNYTPELGKFDRLQWFSSPGEWKLTRLDQSVWRFDSAGRLLDITDSSGNVLTVHRDSGNGYRIDYIQSAADGLSGVGNHRLTFAYDSEGRLETITDPISRVWAFEYDSSDRLAKVLHPDNPYNEDPNEPYSTEFGYDSAGQITSVKDRAGAVWAYTYSSGRIDTVTDPNSTSGSPANGEQQSFVFYSSQINNLWQTDHTDRRGYTWEYRFDDNGRLRELIDPLTNLSSYTYDSSYNTLTK
jgi:YD repeat-containing protein